MNFVTHIDKAGNFPVQQIPCHHFSAPVLLTAPRAGVLHTWEGTGWNGTVAEFKVKYAPHFMIGMNGGKAAIAQLVPIGYIGAALENHNNLAIIQIEMAGFSEDHPWLPGSTPKNPHPEIMEALCSLMNACHDNWGIPLSHPWIDSDWGQYGTNTKHRHSGKFGHIAGWFGHQDVPDNKHWDCGALEWSKVFAHCNELIKPAAPPPPKDSHFADSGKPGAH